MSFFSKLLRYFQNITYMDPCYCCLTADIDRVRTDPGKVWKVLEFNLEIEKP